MPVFLLRYLPHIVAVAVLVGGGFYLRHHWISQGEAAGRAAVEREWADEKAEIARQTALQEAKARSKEEADRKAAKDIQDALQQKLDSADSRARDLAGRLRDYQARERQRSLSQAAGAAAGADSAPGESGDSGEARTGVDAALEAHLGACARDAERLGQWQAWWDRVGQ